MGEGLMGGSFEGDEEVVCGLLSAWTGGGLEEVGGCVWVEHFVDSLDCVWR